MAKQGNCVFEMKDFLKGIIAVVVSFVLYRMKFAVFVSIIKKLVCVKRILGESINKPPYYYYSNYKV